MKLAFFQKPITDAKLFQLMLLLIGNGCSHDTILKWILTSIKWKPDKFKKRAEQMHCIFLTCGRNKGCGFTSTYIMDNSYI